MKQPVRKAFNKPSFKEWYATVPTQKNDTSSYDLEKAYGDLPYSQMKRFAESEAHLPDTYKKPNHPTFSNESIYHNDKTPGGYWSLDPKGRDMFTPTQHNIDNMGGYTKFTEWFKVNEPNVILNMPYNQLQPNTGFKNNSVDDIIKLRKGLTLGFVKNGHWSLVDKLEGPSHEYGGIPLNIDTDGVAFMNNGEFIKAEKGLVIGGEPKRYTYGISKTGTREESNQFKFGERDDIEHFYKTYYGPVSEALRNTGKPIPIDAILAQAYIESTGGRNTLMNNFSGQKAYGSKYEDAATREKDNLKYGVYKTFEYFDTDKKYPTMEFDGKTIIDTVKYKPRKPGEYRQIHSIEPATGPNEGKYKYVLDDYFVEADDATKGFENYINNFYETDRKEYKKAITDEKILADPYKFVETIAPAYSTSSDYANTTKKYVGMMQPYTTKKQETEQKRIDYIENKQNKQKAQDSLPFKDWVDIEVGRSGKTAGEVMGKMSGKAANGMVMNKGGIEAEGGELIIKNNFGDYAIIPKKSSSYVSGLLKGNNMRGIDEFVSGLPTAKNYAEEGLIIGGDLSKLGSKAKPSRDTNTYNASTSTIKPVNPNVNTSLIGKTWGDIPTNNPNYNQPQLKQDTRTDYEREQDQKAMEDYQNPNFIEQLWSGARMVPRAIADPIQGVGQIFDAVGLGDTRIGKDLGNFNDEEAAYRYRNVNPNMSAGEKFMGNLGEGSEVAAWGATNFIPFEGSVINPIVKGLVGKGNYSSYVANQLYSPVVNQGVKEVVESSVINQVDDVGNLENMFRRNPLSEKELELFKWMQQEQRLKNLPKTTNEESLSVLEDFKTRIKTPEGQKRMKDLGIKSDDLLQKLEILEDNSTFGYYTGTKNKIVMNPETPLPRKVTRHEIEHGVQSAIANQLEKDYNTPINKIKSEIDDLLSGLELRKEGTPNKVWKEQNPFDNTAVDINNYKNLVSNKQLATDYFLTGSGGREKSAFLAEIQQYMMDIGAIPKTGYVEITPEMVKSTMVDALFDEKQGGKYLRLFNIIKPSDVNYNLISKGLNKMLGIGTIGTTGAIGASQQNNNNTNSQ